MAKREINDKISIVITSFNRAEMLKRAVVSALNQNYKNKEIIISDNCSTDGTAKVLKHFASHPNIVVRTNNTNLGVNKNFERATKEFATGKYVTYLSSDDELISSGFLDNGLKAMNFEKVKIVHARNVTRFPGDTLDIDDYSYKFYENSYYKLGKVAGNRVFRDYPYCHSISFGGSLYKREDVIRLNPFTEKCFSFDVLLNLQLIQEGDVFFLNEPTYRVYRHGENFTSLTHDISTYIKNLDYIAKPFEKAISSGNYDKKRLYFWLDMMALNYFFLVKPILSQSPKILKKFKSEIDLFLNSNNLNSINFTKILLWNLLKQKTKFKLTRLDKKVRKN